MKPPKQPVLKIKPTRRFKPSKKAEYEVVKLEEGFGSDWDSDSEMSEWVLPKYKRPFPKKRSQFAGKRQ